jgi:acyl-CoA dehydrogenase
MVGWAAFYEEANRSIFGPVILNCQAPDDGNMNLLNKVLPSDEMKERWLQPIIDGTVRSSFVMTEPHPGSGSDPGGMMLTRAERKGDRYVIRGRKWFISGAEVASHFILVARTSDDPRRGLSAFLYHKDDPNWRIVRRIANMGRTSTAGCASSSSTGSRSRSSTGCWKRATGSRSPRSGSARRGSPTACAGSASPSAAWRLPESYVAERQAFGSPWASASRCA